MRRRLPLLAALVTLALSSAAARQETALPADAGVYAETGAGTVPLRKTFSGLDIAGSMPTSTRTRVLVFPIPAVDDVPVAAALGGFIVNLAGVEDARAAASQIRFTVGDHVREPDFQVMAVNVGKF